MVWEKIAKKLHDINIIFCNHLNLIYIISLNLKKNRIVLWKILKFFKMPKK